MAGSRSPEPYAAVLALADRIRALLPQPRILLAIDGVDGAGKTMPADELARMHREEQVLEAGVAGSIP